MDVVRKPVESIIPFEGYEGLYISCDEIYFVKFAYQLLRSIREQSDVPVHIHLIAGCSKPPIDAVGLMSDDENLRSMKSVSISREWSLDFMNANGIAPHDYFGAMRFVRFARAIEETGANLWLMDCDVLCNRNPRNMMAAVDQGLAIRVRPGRVQPWNQFSACLIKGTPGSSSAIYVTYGGDKIGTPCFPHIWPSIRPISAYWENNMPTSNLTDPIARSGMSRGPTGRHSTITSHYRQPTKASRDTQPRHCSLGNLAVTYRPMESAYPALLSACSTGISPRSRRFYLRADRSGLARTASPRAKKPKISGF